MKKNTLITLVSLLSLTVIILSCKKNKDQAPTPQNPNEQEQITTLHLIVKEGSIVVDTFTFRDVDGPGGNAPKIESINLLANKNYNAQLLLLDESKTPIDTISKAIKEERNEHQFFFTPSAAGVTIAYNDADDHGVPVGLEILLNTGAASTGELRIFLKHQPNVKPKTGQGDASLGATDIDVTMPVVVN